MTPEFRTWEDTERNLGTLDGVTYTACRKHNAILSHISKTFEWCSDLVWQKNVETPVNKLTRCELRENVLFHLGSFGIIWIMFAHVGSVPLNNINYVFVALSISGYLYADWHVIFWIPIGIQIEHFLSHNEFMLFCKHVSRLVSPAGNNGNIFMLWRYTVLHILRTSHCSNLNYREISEMYRSTKLHLDQSPELYGACQSACAAYIYTCEIAGV